MVRLAVIADDLTGAMDTGLQFSKHGLETVVSMSWEHLAEAEVVVVDSETRESPATEAYQRLRVLAPLLGDRLIYKKVDSTLRGNVGYELRALHDARHPRAIVVAPAYPASGRTTREGHQQVKGKPLELTFFAHDPRWPMRESHLPTLLMQQSGREVDLVTLDSVEAGPLALQDALRRCHARTIVVDALTEEHLGIIARALVALGPEWIPCGSAGLAEEWVGALGLRRARADLGPQSDPGPALVVSGSRNDATAAQLRLAEQTLALARVELDPQRCYEAEREMDRLAEASLAMLRAGRDSILSATFSPLSSGLGPLVTRVLAGAVQRIVAHQRLGGLFLTGGDTAVGICRALGVMALRIGAEVQPGVPGGQLRGGRGEGLWVVTKAGGFGDERAILVALDYLHARRP
jgi:D-threonate/D-erythronate kinase